MRKFKRSPLTTHMTFFEWLACIGAILMAIAFAGGLFAALMLTSGYE